MGESVKRIHRNIVSGEAVTVTSALTVLGTYDISDMEACAFHFANTGVLLDQFVIYGQFVKDGAFEVLFSSTADFTTPAGILIGSSGDLTGIANGSTGWFILYPAGLRKIRVSAASSGANTVVTINGGGS